MIKLKKLLKNLKKLNHEWCCSKGNCSCNKIELKDEADLGDKIIQEMWDKEKRYRQSKNKE